MSFGAPGSLADQMARSAVRSLASIAESLQTIADRPAPAPAEDGPPRADLEAAIGVLFATVAEGIEIMGRPMADSAQRAIRRRDMQRWRAESAERLATVRLTTGIGD